MNIKKYFISIVLVLGIIVFVNLVSNDFFARFDFTENGQYTLSNASKDLLKNLDDPITIQAYFSKDLPPNIAGVRRDFKDLLIEYANRSKGKIIYEIKDPNADESIEKEALQNGIRPVLINVREKDQVKQQKAFLGAVLKMGDRKEVIPFIQPGAPLEYSLSSAIKKLSVKDKPIIGLLQGQGEPALDELQQVRSELEVLYKIQTITLNDTAKISNQINTLALIRPTDSLTKAELNVLDDFLERGGNILVAISRVKGDLQSQYGSELNTQVESWLQKKGITIEPSFVVDAHCGTVSLQQQSGRFSYRTQIQFPYIPLIAKFADHPVVKGLESLMLPFVSPIEYHGDSSVIYTPLAFSSENSSELKAPIFFDVQKQWTKADFNKPNLVVAAALEGKLSANSHNKMVIIGNGDFAIGDKNSRQQIQSDNVSLFVNGIDWLSDATGLISLRTKAISSRPIDQLEDGTKALLKYLNFLLPIILIIIVGIIRMQRNKSLRLKRMEENYG
jgi:gliding-associated putative ABC transporter substrate-binding component GldG